MCKVSSAGARTQTEIRIEELCCRYQRLASKVTTDAG